MLNLDEAAQRLGALPGVRVLRNEPLSSHTRFGIGGPAGLMAETDCEPSFASMVQTVRQAGIPHVVIGGGTNLIVADAGFPGAVLRYTGSGLLVAGHRVIAQAGGTLQSLVDSTIAWGLMNLHTMTGIPGSTGAAVYGNAGAYGHSMSESVRAVRLFDGAGVRELTGPECEFHYRESIFKRRKDWVILSVGLELEPGDTTDLRRQADEILTIRNQKYPPTMKCAGSIFKNLLLAELPPSVAAQVPARVIREGKVPSAYFLEEVGAKGMTAGDIRVATYHANLIYNEGNGTAADLVQVISNLKERVRARFGLDLEEEVQYVGFADKALE
jgi:UDP-N-acetylmuramate dehydrogenase